MIKIAIVGSHERESIFDYLRLKKLLEDKFKINKKTYAKKVRFVLSGDENRTEDVVTYMAEMYNIKTIPFKPVYDEGADALKIFKENIRRDKMVARHSDVVVALANEKGKIENRYILSIFGKYMKRETKDFKRKLFII